MPDSMQLKLAAARRKWRLVAAASILLASIAASVTLALVSFYSDRMLVLESSGRYYWQIALIGTMFLGALALIVLPARRRIPDEMVAAEVEKKHPDLGERLLSSIELSRGGSAHGASSQMIEALQRETESATSGLSFASAIPTRQVRRPAAFASVAVGALGLHLLLAPDAMAVWLKRIMNPEADIPLYARTQVWTAPDHKVVPRGENIKVTVKLHGRLVDESTLHYKFGAGNWAQARLTKPEVVGTAEGEFRKFKFQIPDAQQDMTFYATAGDGRSNPHTVKVEDRPAVLSVTMNLDYPDYTRKTSETVTASAGNIVAPVGTRVNVIATANKPLGSVSVVRGKDSAAWTVDEERARGQLVVSKDETYSLKLKDRNGFDAEQAPQYTIRAQPDRAPEVQVAKPGADVDRTPDATVNLKVTASDDYGVESTAIAYQVGAGKGSLPLPGARGSTQVTASAGWNLASLNLKPGDTVVYYAAAKDGDTVSGPHTGKSAEYRINILSRAEMRERLDAQQAQEREALKQLVLRQKDAQKALDQAQKNPANPDKLSQAQGAQRSVAQETSDLARRMEQTTQQMRENNLSSPQQDQQRESTRQSLQSLAQKSMPQAADTIQRAQNQASTRSQDLRNAAQQEQAIKDELDRLVREQEPGNDLAQIADEAERLAQEQQRLAEESNLAAAQTENKAASAMTPQERARMNELAKKQAQLNAQTKQLEKALQRAANEAQQNARQNAQDVNKAAQQMKQSGLQQQQSSAQQNLQSGKPQEASPQQSDAAQKLQELAKSLDEAMLKSDTQELEKRADQLEQAGDELMKLYTQQRQVLNETLQNPGQAKAQNLAQREREINEQAKRVEQQLKDAPSAQQTLQRAQRSVDAAAQRLGEFQPSQAVPPERQAVMDFLRAAQEAQEAARNMREQQAAREMQQQVEKMAREQRELMKQTKGLDSQRKNGAMSPADQQKSADLAARQQRLAQQGQEMAQDMPSTPFRWAMGQANRRMENARQGLQSQNTGEQTQRHQENAAQTLERIARSLGRQAQGQQQQQQAGSQQSGAQQQMSEGTGELQLAREMEAQLRQETAGIEQQRSRNPGRQLSAEQQRELSSLSQAQRDIKRFTESAAQRFRSEPEIHRNIQRAAEEMDAVQDRLQQQDSSGETQGMQQRIVQTLDRAIRQSQQAMRQQRQQMAQAQQQQQQGEGQQQQNQPGGNNPAQRGAPPLSNVQYGKLNKVDPKGRGFGNLSPRAMQNLREGRQERVPAEYRELVNQYYKALSERSGK